MSSKVKIYLAGASAEIERVKSFADGIEERGLEITHKWWCDVEVNGGPGNDHLLSHVDAEKHALSDLQGLIHADIVWTLWASNRGGSEGAPFETGYALAWRDAGLGVRHVVITGERVHECIFTRRADYHDASDLCGLVEVMRLAALIRRERGVA